MTDFIAEVCSNHNGDLNRALALIDKAVEIGCSGVKFQLFRIDSLFAPEALAHPDYQFIQQRREWELPLEWLPILKARCVEWGIQFGCTPFYIGAVEELLPFVDFYKVASYSLLHDDLLEAIANTGKPIILSTGMADYEEINWAILMLSCVKDLTILHCVSSYPTPLSQVNPARLFHLEERFGHKVGYSDHSVNPAVVYVLHNVTSNKLIEFHLDLDGQGREYNIGHCWLPEQIAPVIVTCKELDEVWTRALKEELEFSPSEQQERLWRADPSDGLRPLREERERLR